LRPTQSKESLKWATQRRGLRVFIPVEGAVSEKFRDIYFHRLDHRGTSCHIFWPAVHLSDRCSRNCGRPQG